MRNYLFIAASFFLLNCSKTTIDEPKPVNYETEQLNALYNNQITTLQKDHLTATQNLLVAAKSFNSDASEVNLNLVKAKWKTAFLIWKKFEIYNIGDVENAYIHSTINRYPSNYELIEKNILESTEKDNSYIESLGSSSKGYSAVEYLIFHESNAVILNEFVNSINRKKYLVALCENIQTKSIQLNEIWMKYETKFKTTTEKNISGTQNQLINSFLNVLEKIKMVKLNAPFTTIPPDPKLLEAHYSKLSKDAILANLISLQELYTGNSNSKSDIGFYEIINFSVKNPELANAIEAKFTKTIEIAQKTNTLESITTSTEIKDLNDSLTELIALIKNNMAPSLNAIITVNDNDGD